MANLTGTPQVFEGDTSVVYDSEVVPVGTIAFDADGNEYIFLEGVASTILGSWVTFDEAGATALLAANAVGPVAIAMAAIEANEYGWYLRAGSTTAASADDTADNTALYIDATAGRVDDAAVAGDLVFNAFSRSADASNLITAQIDHPFVCDGAYLT